MSSSPSYLDPVVLHLLAGESVLDVGCGYARWCHLIQTSSWEAGLATPPAVDGFDAFRAERRALPSARPLPKRLAPGASVGARGPVGHGARGRDHRAPAAGRGGSAAEQLEGVAARRIIVTMPRNAMVGERGGADQIGGLRRVRGAQELAPDLVLPRPRLHRPRRRPRAEGAGADAADGDPDLADVQAAAPRGDDRSRTATCSRVAIRPGCRTRTQAPRARRRRRR